MDERGITRRRFGHQLEVFARRLALERQSREVVFLLLDADVGVAARQHGLLAREGVAVHLLGTRRHEGEADAESD